MEKLIPVSGNVGPWQWCYSAGASCPRGPEFYARCCSVSEDQGFIYSFVVSLLEDKWSDKGSF